MAEERVAIRTSTLDDIGDALRAHFGNKQEGTVGVHAGSEPKVLRSSNFKKLMTLENGKWTDTYIGFPHTDIMKQEIKKHYAEFLDFEEYYEPTPQAHVNTIRVPGAAYIGIKMCYLTNGLGPQDINPDPDSSDHTNTTFNYMWIAPGLHEEATKLDGEYLPAHSLSLDNITYHEEYCAVCGLESWYGEPILPPGIDFHPCGGPGEFPIKLTISFFKEPTKRTYKGDSFTLIWNINTNHTVYDAVSEVGYYIELTPYDENLNPMSDYVYIVNEIPNTYYPAMMPLAIQQLNNYPDAEEVKF